MRCVETIVSRILEIKQQTDEEIHWSRTAIDTVFSDTHKQSFSRKYSAILDNQLIFGWDVKIYVYFLRRGERDVVVVIFVIFHIVIIIFLFLFYRVTEVKRVNVHIQSKLL